MNAINEMPDKSLHPEIILTLDGSSSLFVPELKEQYHSRFGAITESMHIYIGHGLHANRLSNISIFEMGFGTGLNAFLTFLEIEKSPVKVHYDSVELYPLPHSITNQLGYATRMKCPDELFLKLHKAEWEKEIELSDHFILKKVHQDFQSYIFNRKYDVIYYDAFAPLVQPELWTQEIFNKISATMNPGAIFVTYSAMGEIRRRLVIAGLEVKRLPGPPGKREILQAHKP